MLKVRLRGAGKAWHRHAIHLMQVDPMTEADKGKEEAHHLPQWHPLEGPGWSPPADGTAGTEHPGCCESIAPREA